MLIIQPHRPLDRRTFARGAARKLLLLLVCARGSLQGAQNHIDSSAGDDSRSGFSPAEAWRTFQKPNSMTYQPGDELLLKRGGRWHGTLHPLGSGALEHPIRLATFGEGPRPAIDGGAGPAVHIKNQDAWIIEGLDLSNAKNSGQDALWIWAEPRRPHYRFIRIRDCVAHDAGRSGIHVGEDSYGNYDDVMIEDSVAFNNQDSGIFIQGKDFGEVRKLAIRRSVAYGNGWDGIKIYSGCDSVIEHCTAYRNGWKQDARVGIWCWNSENMVIQNCEAYANVTPCPNDGGGFDIDWSSVGCVIQYCYSHDNDGAGYLFMGSGRGFTTRTVVRFNVSQNDGRKNDYGGLLCYGTLQDSEVYNNIFYFKGSKKGAAINFRGEQEAGYPSNVRVFNNIVIAEGGRALLRLALGAAKQNNTFDFDDYFSTAGFRIVWNDKEFSDFERFRKTTGQENQGLRADPRLKGAGRAVAGRLPPEDYRLLTHSPCLRTGREYAPEFGTLDYWGKALEGVIRMNIGPEQ